MKSQSEFETANAWKENEKKLENKNYKCLKRVKNIIYFRIFSN
jgi:hypothetical protein